MFFVEILADEFHVAVQDAAAESSEHFERFLTAAGEQERLWENNSARSTLPVREILDQVTMLVTRIGAHDAKHLQD